MKLHMLVALLGLGLGVGGCSKPAADGDCKARVARVAANLAAPRSIEDIRKAGPPELAADLDAALAEPEGSSRAVKLAERLELASTGCAEVVKVFGEVASVEAKDAHLRGQLPPALEACGCKVSPERVGGLVESILGEWSKPR